MVHFAATEQFSIPDLRARLTGRVIAPGDADYDQARTVFLGSIDRRPAVIARVANAADVQAVIALARATSLPLAVRSGGHSASGQSVVEGGIVLDLADMRALDIDVAGRTAWAETGLTTGEFTQAAAEHGLALGFGDTASVGIGGITLGGGIGYLVRLHGLTIDQLLAAEMVTADGQLRRVDAAREPDLFWAIRGGGGNFGVATRFQYRLHALPQVYGGLLILPASAELIRDFVAAAEAAPEALSAIANVMPAPPMPFLKPEDHGRLILMAMMVYAGPAEAGEHALAPFRALAKPLADMVHTMPYTGVYPPEDSSYHPVAISRTLFADTLSQRAAQAIVARIPQSTGLMAVTQIRVLGGAMARVPADATAFAHRARRLMLTVAAIYSDPAQPAPHQTWVNGLLAELARDQTPGAYVNLTADEGEARVREAYPGATWERLSALKRRYDPTNLFRLNQNISPAA